MAGWLDRLGATLIDATLAATAITGLVVLAMLQCRQPARRQVWARAGLLSTLALFPLAALNPVPRIDLRAMVASVLANTLDDSSTWTPANHSPGFGRSNSGPREGCGDIDFAAPRGYRRVGHALVLIYLAGLTLSLCWLALGHWGVVLLVRRGRSPSDSSLRLYQSLPVSGASKRPRLLVSEETTRPALVGSFWPVILIPPDLDKPGSTDRLRLALLHELAHAGNSDHRFNPLARFAESVWFFLPTFWWLRDQMKLDQEFLADRWAVSHFGTSGHYASSLVGLAAWRAVDHEVGSRTPIQGAPISVPGVASALFQRVQMLLKCPFPIEGETPLWWRWSAVMTLMLATTAASCLTIRGLGGWWGSIPLTQPDVPRSFQLPQLVIAPRDDQHQPFELPYRLPDEFTLTLEVMAEPGDLQKLEILGHRLAPLEEESAGKQVYRLWHRVRIRRLQGFDFMEVNGHKFPSKAVPISRTPWITILPLSTQPTRLRDLMLEW